MESFHVIIIGAGPAGLNCAETLAKSNKKILLLEQNEVIGPKICAGGLTGHDLDYLKLPDNLLDHKYKEITIHTPLNKDVIKLDKYFVYTIDRRNLGQWQLKKLRQFKNIVVRTKSKVSRIEKNHVMVNNSEKMKFKYLIGADGSTSIVRRYLGLKTDLGIAIQYIIPTKKYKKIEFFLDSNLFHSWLAWIFPHKNYVSIGCGSDPKVLPSNKLILNFKKWLKKNKIDVSKGEYQAFPISYNYQGYCFKNIFLAGDAAGLPSGITGEGIYQALISGEEIAQLIIDKNYISLKMDEIIRVKQLHDNVLHYLEKSGPFRQIEYDLLGLILKSKLIDKKLLNVLTI